VADEPQCTCVRINTCWAGNPHGHDCGCPRHGTDLPLELPKDTAPQPTGSYNNIISRGDVQARM
jgi:hypothetical protein